MRKFYTASRQRVREGKGSWLQITPDQSSTKYGASVTLQAFITMANHGRIHTAAEDMVEPSELELKKARSPVDFGRLHGYSEDDIACFYLKRRRGRADIAYAEYIQDLKCANFPPSKPSPAK